MPWSGQPAILCLTSNRVADKVNSDSEVAGLLTVVFIPNYSVSIAQVRSDDLSLPWPPVLLRSTRIHVRL